VRKKRNRIEPAFAAAVAREERELRGFDRKDSIAALCAILAAGAITTNALFLQRGPHPAPILVSKPVAAPAVTPASTPRVVGVPAAAPAPAAAPVESRDVMLPRSRPPEAHQPAKLDAVKSEPVKAEPLPKADAPPRPVRNIPLPESNAPRQPDPIGEIIAPPARRVAAVQRVLSEYGYGQIKATGTLDRETQDAIEQFQRAKKLTVTRQITPELMRELAVLAGRPLD
jgi:hypothetical protein